MVGSLRTLIAFLAGIRRVRFLIRRWARLPPPAEDRLVTGGADRVRPPRCGRGGAGQLRHRALASGPALATALVHPGVLMAAQRVPPRSLPVQDSLELGVEGESLVPVGLESGA